jgi:hypothetical protein
MKHLKKLVVGGVAWAAFGAAISACQSPSTGYAASQQQLAKESQPASVARRPEPPRFTEKAPPVREATQDEIEVLEGTYRTERSREELLDAIANGHPDLKKSRVEKFKEVANTLPPAEREKALEELAKVAPQ